MQVEKANLTQLSQTLKSACATGMKKAKSAEDAGNKIGAAVQQYVEQVIKLVEQAASVEMEEIKQSIPPAGGGGGMPGA